jgi:hypothetical protein
VTTIIEVQGQVNLDIKDHETTIIELYSASGWVNLDITDHETTTV